MSGRKAGSRWPDADARILGAALAAGVAGCVAVAVARRAALEQAPPPPDPSAWTHRVDLATAPECELRLLPGVGPALAARIAEERRTGGPFASVADLERRVPGIGPSAVGRWGGRVREAP